jgi:stage II sporulation protein AA (anti-sigma F factor antagonist)
MRLTEEPHDQMVVLCIDGRVDSLTSSELETALLAMIARGARSIVLDFARVDYISSAGLRVLLIGAKKMRECQGSISLAALQTGVKDVLAVTGFLNLFRVFRSKESAILELAASP